MQCLADLQYTGSTMFEFSTAVTLALNALSAVSNAASSMPPYTQQSFNGQ
jgi:hypothetical protein